MESVGEDDMSSTNEQDRKKLSLSGGRSKLSLGKSVEAGQVKQSFSHGRSKTVQVEVRRRRAPTPPAAGGREATGDVKAGAKGGRELTAEERAARTRALQEGLKHGETPPPESAPPSARAQESSVAVEPTPAEVVEETPAATPITAMTEAERRKAELDEARRGADSAARASVQVDVNEWAATMVAQADARLREAEQTLRNELLDTEAEQQLWQTPKIILLLRSVTVLSFAFCLLSFLF